MLACNAKIIVTDRMSYLSKVYFMMKLRVFSTLTLSTLFAVSSCSQMKSHMKNDPSREMSGLMETMQLKDEEIFETTPKNGEYTHEIAEANADDKDIKKIVGVTELDEELPGSEDDKIPYSRDFLAKKNTKRMQFWVEYFTKKNRDRFQRFINNGEEYRHIIEQTFVSYGLPKELYYVGLIESGYYLGAKSHASAVGPWQFIKGTGLRYGLKITPELDERQDLFKASKAAAMYFKDLHNIFSSWELALSAYNAGENGIIRRIMKYGTRDFYKLSKNKQLPSETINYVPKVLAAMHVIKNAKKYGFIIPQKKHRLFDLTELIPIKKNVSLVTIAKRLNVSTKLLRKLNPELKRNQTPRRFAGTYYLRIPKNQYAYRLDDVKSETILTKPESPKEVIRRTARVQSQVTPKVYRVKRGDTLISISRKFKTTPLRLAQANGFRSWKTRVRIGQRLKLSQADEQKTATRTVATKVRVVNKPIIYKVRRGDNLTDIARIFDLKLSKIKRANNLKRGNIQIGQKIVLPDTRKGIYTVKRGDHLTKVAREFKQDLNALIKLNSLKRKTIYPGQKLIVNMD
jgi:membrane-bound lytic murein transglycosylase D